MKSIGACLLRTSDLQHCAQSCSYFAYFIEVLRSCRSYWWSPFLDHCMHSERMHKL